MKSKEHRIAAIEKLCNVAQPRYFRDWRFETMEPARRLACYREVNGIPMEITEAEYLAAVPDAPTNEEAERFCGQRMEA